ncbi:unnamed protein product [Blepharisma stoltei]|uniref:Uncharacterized protein n=1 Tax=Blepharisma stoltei TaxID=1481888 RepID=A0AAU9JGL2_9CILI|nr:unnamed protein product [Blepharisma stoltei]
MWKILFFTIISLAYAGTSLEELKENSCYSLTMWLQRQKHNDLEKVIEAKPHLDASNIRTKIMERAFNNCMRFITEEEAREVINTSPSKQSKFEHLVPILNNGLETSKDIEVDFMYFKKRRDIRYRLEVGNGKKGPGKEKKGDL